MLNAVNARARHGHILAVVGPSGPGKSTFPDAVAGRINRSSLDVSIFLRFFGGSFLPDMIRHDMTGMIGLGALVEGGMLVRLEGQKKQVSRESMNRPYSTPYS